MVFKFRIDFFLLPFFFLDTVKGSRITDSFCLALPYITLKNRIILTFCQTSNSLGDKFVVYICGQEKETK